MSPIQRRLSVLECAASTKVLWLVATDKADAERQQTDRDARGETNRVRFIFTGVPRNPDFGKW